MRRAAKIDANQPEIVQALRATGCTVHSTAAIGAGFPDLIVGKQGVTVLMEVKDGRKPPSARDLTPDQTKWHAEWKGAQVVVVLCIEDALQAMDWAIKYGQ